MGMFDYFRSSYDLGKLFTNNQCQTTDIEDIIGGTMTQYWLCPNGQLYWVDYSYTFDFVELKAGDEEYREGKFAWTNFKWIPNGTRGRVRPMYEFTKYVTIYPEQWKGEWENFPECHIHFIEGKLRDYSNLSKRK